MRIRILGTGTSFGVPQVGCDCAVCRSADPRDRRTRSSVLVEADGASLLIDTTPELRLQLLTADVRHVDAVLYTHEHADHIAGIDDLRIFSARHGQPLPIHGPQETLDRIRSAFAYIFDDAVQPPEGTSKPLLSPSALNPGVEVSVAGVTVLPIEVDHGDLRVFGYRIGAFAYITDAKRVTPEALDMLRGLDVLVLNALWWRPHPRHLSIPEAIAVAQQLGARRTLLTHLTHETGHAELAAQLPPGIEPASDGLVVEVA